MFGEKVENGCLKPHPIYFEDGEVEQLKKEAVEISKLLNKKITLSKMVRLKLKMNGDKK